jgi:YYY domain-containing protein
VRLYRKTPAYSEALVRSYLDPIDLENTILYWPKQVSASPSALYMDDEETLRQQSGGTWSEIFDLEAAVNRSPVAATLAWLAVIELLGLAAFPLLWVVLRRLPDRGYGLAKTAGVLALAWLAWFLPALKAAPYARGWIMLCLGLLVGAGAAAGWRRRRALLAFVRQNGGLILSEEALFLAFFLLFLLIRAGNPDLWHPARGGEKPMDFAYLNAVIRSTHFPPYDPWHAGGFINYYYFGFVIVGTLVKLTGIVPWVAYNLAVPTLFALTASGAFSVAFALADGDPATCFPGEEPPWRGLRIGSLLAGLAGAFFVTVVGNLGNLKLVFEQLALRDPSPGSGTGFLASTISALGGLIAVALGNARLDFPNDWWFWNASRAIPDTINEFPFFTFTYADLHAHMIALPLTLVALGSAVALARSVARPQGVPPRAPATEEPAVWSMTLPELLPLLLSGFVLGALRATNTWDFPTYALATVAALVVLEAVRRRHATLPAGLLDAGAYLFRAGVSVLWRAAIVLVVATVLFFPYGRYYATAYAGLQPWTDAMTRISDYLVVHGFVLLVVSIYLASEAVHQLRAGEAPPWIADAAPAIAALGVLLVGAGWVLGVRVWLIALPLAVAALVLAAGRNVPPARRLTLLWLALALAITMGVEVIRQKDDLGRMNTVFKFYMQAWTLFGVTAAAGLATWVPRALSWRPAWRALAYASTAVLFAATLIYPPTAARAKVRDRFSEEASPVGLDGMAYMDKAVHVENGRDVLMADDKAAMLWMLENVKGSPVILEAQLPEYRWGSRFSIYTGLPVVQGWNWHQRQQRSVVPGVAVERRVGHVQEIYNTTDVGRAVRLLDLYGVTYIVVGELERSQYAPEGLAKFDALASAGYLREAYRGGAVSVYEVVGRGQTSPASIPAEPAMRVVPTITPGGEPLSEERRKAMESEPELPTPAPFDSPGG